MKISKEKQRKILLVLDIIVILCFIGMYFYVKKEKAVFEMFLGDPCKICMAKADATCIPNAVANLPKLNLTNFTLP